MTPTQLRALVGSVLVPNVRAVSEATARYKVLGFGTRSVRVQSVATGERSEIDADELERALDDGTLERERTVTRSRDTRS